MYIVSCAKDSVRVKMEGKHRHKADVLSRVVYLSRCVKGEGEIEKLQTKVVELRRKLDDTTAAMQELGRENQSLQVRWDTASVSRSKPEMS